MAERETSREAGYSEMIEKRNIKSSYYVSKKINGVFKCIIVLLLVCKTGNRVPL